MRQSFIACIFVFVLISVLFSANPLLWKVEGDTPVYVFGTIHFPDPRVLELDDRVSSSFEKSDILVLEANLSNENIMSVMKYMFLPNPFPFQRFCNLNYTKSLIRHLQHQV
jgi:uncharacterized protein YbaP (TraB family)